MEKKIRCSWAESPEILREYHDTQWGVPVHDERLHFEYLVLESMQAGLNWLIMLKKRENFRAAFDNFEYKKIARYNADKIEELMENPGIVRNRRKIEAIINNAACFMEVQKEWGSFDAYIWSFTNGKVIQGKRKSLEEIPVTSTLSDTMSKDMKKRGFKFLGSTTLYAHLQAIGVVNDHLKSCFCHKRFC